MNHLNLSLAKSALRIFGYFSLLLSIPVAIVLLVLAEVIGIAEELV